jgi:inosine/xanthosine triphosphatase
VNIILGSENPAKIKAVRTVFLEKEIIGAKVSSDVSAQPFSDEETRQGAINRAMKCIKEHPSAMGIGLEGGVMFVDDQLFLCNWGALVTPEKDLFTASGARILLPEEITEKLQQGTELGDVMDSYARKKEVRNKEGAVGIFTNDRISRKYMFEHVVWLLRGQMEYWIMKKQR